MYLRTAKLKFQKSHPGKDCASGTNSLDGGLRSPSSFVNNILYSSVRNAEEMSFVLHHILWCTFGIRGKLGINEYDTVEHQYII